MSLFVGALQAHFTFGLQNPENVDAHNMIEKKGNTDTALQPASKTGVFVGEKSPKMFFVL